MKTLLTILLIAVIGCAYGQKSKSILPFDTSKWKVNPNGYFISKDTSEMFKPYSSYLYFGQTEEFARIKAGSDTFEINPKATYYYGIRVRYIKVGNTIIKLND